MYSIIHQKYPSYHGADFDTRADFEAWLTPTVSVIREWNDGGVHLIEVGDDSLYTEIVAIPLINTDGETL